IPCPIEMAWLAIDPPISGSLDLGNINLTYDGGQIQNVNDHQHALSQAPQETPRAPLCGVMLEVAEALLQERAGEMALNGVSAREKLIKHSRTSKCDEMKNGSTIDGGNLCGAGI